MLTILVILIVLNVVVFITKSSGAGLTALRGVPAKPAPEHCGDARRAIVYYQRQVNRWRSKMGAADVRRVRRGADPTRRLSCPHIRHLAAVWHNRATAARTAYRRWWRRMDAKWGCIHRHEGAWNANTGNGYWGGLQMTMAFQWAHGPEFVRRWGTADRWPPWAQIIAAERAWKADGESFREWGTARMCGLR